MPLTPTGRTHLLPRPLALLLLKPPIASVGHRGLLGASLGRMGSRHIKGRGGASIGRGGEGLGVKLRRRDEIEGVERLGLACTRFRDQGFRV